MTVGLRAAVRPPRSLARLHRWRFPDSLRSAHGTLASVVSAAPVLEFLRDARWNVPSRDGLVTVVGAWVFILRHDK